jgi:hypothetical protein
MEEINSTMLLDYKIGHNNLLLNLLRVIEVSMWGNIAIEETVDVRHNGAVLKVILTYLFHFPDCTGTFSKVFVPSCFQVEK